MIVTVVGVRAVFAMPMGLKSNWIFRVAESAPTREYLAAIRRPLFVLGVAPVWIVSACVYFALWPFERAAEHLTILGLCGAIVAYACLNGFRKIPFTCSFLPGKSGIHMVILASMGMVLVISQAVRIEAGLLDHPQSFAAAAAMLAIVMLALRSWITRDEESGVQFEESEPPAVLTLGLDASP